VVLAALIGLGNVTPAPAAVGNNRRATASAFASRIVRLIGENRYAEAWASLHPLHQQVVPLERYVECENLTPVPGQITSLRTLRAWNAAVDVAGLPSPVPGTKVKLRIVLADASIPARVVVVKTVALVKVARHWVWSLPRARYAAYLAGDCPQ
jgi:hypothetical protein